ncbi:MAG TPA: orotidine-5'-phosphate decarboxylase [Myxococcaceae bacterium]|nr:orotidine-5'-phosphate decarboxylase [Myxococcaceae bacterium]
MRTPSRSSLALAADLPLPEALELYRRVEPWMGWAKVGLSLFVEHGPAAVEAFRAQGAQVFLDLKLHDIPNTVRLAAARAGALGVGLLTVHASGGRDMVAAAVEGAEEGAAAAGHAAPGILAVTVLTSTTPATLAGLGVTETLEAQVQRLAEMALAAGARGLVCAPHEAGLLRAALGPHALLCTPGIRPSGADRGDQARARTPAEAWAAGADLLVVGRPVYRAEDPVTVARSLLEALNGSA